MPRERLSPLDASFLYLDGEVTCNQGVGLNIIDGPIDFERLVEEMQRKVQYVERMRQRVVFSPLNLFSPTWEFDPAFDIRNHVKRIVIEPPDEAKCKEAVEHIFATKLDRAHPLWCIYVIEGLPGNRAIHLAIIHHCVSDGIGFSKFAAAFFDADRDMALDPWTPPR